MERREVYHRGLGLVLFAAGLILFMSVASYNPHDPPGSDYPVYYYHPANICGTVGAHMAWLFRLLFGTGSYLIALMLAVIGSFMVILYQITDRWMRLAGVVLFLLSWCAGMALLFTTGGSPYGHGGMIGWALGPGMLLSLGTGGYVVVLLGLVLGALLTADAFVLWLGRKGVEVLTMRGDEEAPAAREKTPKPPAPEPATEPVSKDSVDKMAEQKELLRKRIEERAKAKAEAPLAEEPTVLKTVPLPPPPAKPPVNADAATVLVKPKEPKDLRKPKPRKPVAGGFALPPLDLLDPVAVAKGKETESSIAAKQEVLERTLEEFGIAAQVVEIDRGPVITQFELELAPGVKINKIAGLSDDIARALKATSVRVVAPIPGKSTVGVEVPNTHREIVQMRDLFDSGVLDRKKMTIPLMLGKDASGEPLIADLAQMPHMLIAGATGSGKSVCMNSVIMTMLMTQAPDDLKLLLVDPKMVELSAFRDVPHLMAPVLTDMKKTSAVLEWACRKMDERYSMLANVGVRNIASFNALGEKEIRKRLEMAPDEELEGIIFRMPYWVIIIDELADLMMVSAKEVENTITRLAQKSRAVGIHLIVATQRPSVDGVTGLIKANLPCRLAFQTASKIDSRTILDRNGADKLLGKGDMLFLPPGSSKLIRSQGTYTSDDEIHRVIGYLKEHATPDFEQELVNPKGLTDGEEQLAEDDLFNDAVRIILESQRGSVSLLQRKLGIGYSRASRLIDMMGEAGIVGEYKGSQAREVNYTLEQWDEQHGGGNGGQPGPKTEPG